MKLKTKALAFYLVSLLLIGLLVSFFTGQMQSLHRLSNEIQSNWMPRAIILERIYNLTSEYRLTEARLLLNEDQSVYEGQIRQNMDRLKDRIDIRSNDFKAFSMDHVSATHFAEFEQHWVEYLSNSKQLIDLWLKGEQIEALVRFEGNQAQLYAALTNELQELVEIESLQASLAKNKSHDIIAYAKLSNIIFALSILVFFTICFMYFNKQVVHMITTLADKLKRLSLGEQVPMEMVPGSDEFGDMVKAVQIFKTNAEELEQSNRRFLQLIQRTQHGILVHDYDQVLFSNKVANELLYGDKLKKVVDLKSFVDCFDMASQNKLLDELLFFKNKSSTDLTKKVTELVFRDNNNRLRYFDLLVQQVDWMGNVVFLTSIYDNTEHKFAQELKRKVELAEIEKLKANAANEQKTKFLSSISHELRTPLNSIIGFAQLLLYNVKCKLNTESMNYVEVINRNAKYLLQLIDDVLELSKIETGKVKISLDKVEMVGLIQECRDILAQEALTRRVDFKSLIDSQSGIYVYGDYTRLKQVMLNIMNNSIKYNKEGGQVLISDRKTEERYILSIKDTGMGIPDNMKDAIFRPFDRLGQENSNVQGTGIGLTISKHLLLLMDGRIEFESQEGQGTTFHIDLPLTKSPRVSKLLPGNEAKERQPAMHETLPTLVQHKNVLYVEDNPSNILLMQEIVKLIPAMKLYSAESAEQGLELVKQNAVDLIFLDINLPGMSGVEAQKQFKMLEELHHVPIVAISANASKNFINQCLAEGFDDYIAKPFNIDQVLKKFHELV